MLATHDHGQVAADGMGEAGWNKYLPVSINCAYGDPLIKQQEVNTYEKLEHLASSGHLAPFGFCTKGVLSDRAAKLFSSLPPSSRYVFRYSLTGLGEAGCGLDKRIESMTRLGEIFGGARIIVSPRPIIAGRNDDEKTLAKIVEAAVTCGGTLIIGGLHDAFKHKTVAARVDSFLRAERDRLAVRYFYKSSCSSAFVTGSACWMHDLGSPKNLEAVREMGYEFELVPFSELGLREDADDKGPSGYRIVLRQATTGDLNFIRTVTASTPYTRQLVSNYNLISRSPALQDLEHTSSWYVWARNLPQCLNCDYCIINQIEYLEQTRKDIGVPPSNIPTTVAGQKQRLPLMEKGGKMKLHSTDNSLKGYNSLRVRKECRRHVYDRTTWLSERATTG